jgi:hypothetical protein
MGEEDGGVGGCWAARAAAERRGEGRRHGRLLSGAVKDDSVGSWRAAGGEISGGAAPLPRAR